MEVGSVSLPHGQSTRKRRRGGAAGLSIVPTNTRVAKANARIIPDLGGRIEEMRSGYRLRTDQWSTHRHHQAGF